jgi:hypothetical protein
VVNDVEGKPLADDFVVLNLLPRGIVHTAYRQNADFIARPLSLGSAF